MALNQEILAIQQRLVETIKPIRLYLFGSYAKNTFTEDSDYDFYLVVPDDAGNKLTISQKAYKSIREIRNKPVDIIIGHESMFNNKIHCDSLERTVVQEGVLLHVQQ